MKPIETSLFALHEAQEENTFDFHPKTFEDYLGQKDLKEKLHVYTLAARMRDEPLDHVLFFGPPGLGKTTLANIMANIMSVGIKICNGPILERTGDLIAILSGLDSKDILFIDEIHRMPTAVEEVLYNAMEHYKIDVIIGQGAGAKSINLPLNKFTLIGATTKASLISAPLRSRFGIIERIDFYNDEDLKSIILQNAKFLKLEMNDESALKIAQGARGTPRIAKKLLRRLRDFIQVNQINKIDKNIITQALNFFGIDSQGLTIIDYNILKIISERFNGGPIGIETLASLVGEDPGTIEDVYEPYLLRKGYIEKTPRGRRIPFNSLDYIKKRLAENKNII